MRSSLSCLTAALLLGSPALAQQAADPAVGSWVRNLDGNTGKSAIPGIHSAVSQIEADVQGVLMTPVHAFVRASGIPSHTVGPFGDGNPGMPGDQAGIYRIPRSPVEETGAKMPTPLGGIGVLVNGVAIFGPRDAQSFQNQGIWNQNAIYFEGQGMDTGLGHPAGDYYHYHQRPTLLMNSEGQNGIDHAPILGFAYDGFPIYGSYAFAGTDGSGGVVRMRSSFQTRNITLRDTLPDGTVLPQNQWGPPVSAQFPLGAYVEDYEYVAGLGDLDEHNGRTCVTPEYPQGTYAYFATIDAAGESAYPYLLGPNYYGVVDVANLGQGPGSGGGGPGGGGGGGGPGAPQVNIPPVAVEYAPFGLYEYDMEVGGQGTISFGDADPGAVLFFGYTFLGPGPTPTAFGELGMDLPFSQLGPFNADAQGAHSLNVNVPAGLAGLTVYSQSLMIAGGQFVLSNPERVLFQ